MDRATVAPIDGSSPLARGLRPGHDHARTRTRIIPARAGFTPPITLRRPQRTDHPRSRGVYVIVFDPKNSNRGSSPLARGLPWPPKRAAVCARIIPARAGFTRENNERNQRPEDHPRSRGVYPHRYRECVPYRGSSPLARGLPPRRHRRLASQRIIPARAGFTRAGCGCLRSAGDHPRSRGVYDTRVRLSNLPVGSSPLARGLRRAAGRRRRRHRIIPARAGFTEYTCSVLTAGSDHPRSRGVYYPLLSTLKVGRGSSPLARGLH